MLNLSGATPLHIKAPEGVKLPNNEKYDTEDGGATTASPDQGHGDGTGGADGSVKSDLRTDTVSAEALLHDMGRDELLDTLRNLMDTLDK